MLVVLVGNSQKYSIKNVLNYLKKKFNNVIYLDSSSLSKKKISKKLNSLDINILISYYSYYIFPFSLLKKTKLININFHPGSRDFPGFGCYNFALLKNSKSYGCIAHEINKKIDQGPIISEKTFNITNINNVEELQKITERHMYKLLIEVFNSYLKKKQFIFNEKVKWSRRPYTRNDFNKIFTLNKKLNKNLLKILKASYHKRYENTYFLDKYKLVIDEK